MTWTLTTSGAAIAEAGVHANSAIIASAATLLNFCTQIEGFICVETHYDWIANYTGLNARIKGMLNNICVAGITPKIVKYDSTGYLTREADILLNTADETWSSGLKFLSIKQNQTLT